MGIPTQSSILIRLSPKSPPILAEKVKSREIYQVASAIVPIHQDNPCSPDCPRHKNIYPINLCLDNFRDFLNDLSVLKNYGISNPEDIGYGWYLADLFHNGCDASSVLLTPNHELVLIDNKYMFAEKNLNYRLEGLYILEKYEKEKAPYPEKRLLIEVCKKLINLSNETIDKLTARPDLPPAN